MITHPGHPIDLFKVQTELARKCAAESEEKTTKADIPAGAVEKLEMYVLGLKYQIAIFFRHDYFDLFIYLI